MPALNNLFLIILGIAIIYSFVIRKRKNVKIPSKIYYPLLSVLIIYIVFTRFYHLDSLPLGLNQDEAAAGYDAWALARYGIDRNGYTFPILPVSWGSGAGGFYFYYLTLFFKFVELNVFWLRFPNAILQLISIVIFFDLIRRIYDKNVALIGLFFIAICPWHIMLSRWALDANQVFALLLIGVYFTFLAESKKTFSFHLIAIVFYALTLYSYGSSMIVVPILLLLIYGYLLFNRKISISRLIVLVMELLVVCSPLIAFYFINIFKLEEIRTSIFSIPRFIVLRSNSTLIPFDHTFFAKVISNLISTIGYLTVGNNDFIWNQINSYGIFYLFTFPLFIIGFIISIIQFKEKGLPKRIMLYWFFSAFVYSLIVLQNINRLGILFIPYLYFNILGAMYIIQKSRVATITILTMFIIAASLFHYEYFVDYNNTIQYNFNYGYGEATKYALSLNKEHNYLPSQNRVNGSYILALFYIQPDPNEFVESAVYLNPDAEFRYASYFESNHQKFYFENLDDIKIDEDDVYIIKEDDFKYFDFNTYQKTQFGLFYVVNKKQ